MSEKEHPGRWIMHYGWSGDPEMMLPPIRLELYNAIRAYILELESKIEELEIELKR